MRIPGHTRVQLLLLMILATSSVLSTSLLIGRQARNTSVENIFGRRESLRGGGRRVTSESNWKKYYGSCPELNRDIGDLGHGSFERRILSLHTTGGRTNFEETRQLFRCDVLTESLTDGTPAYYNSNILGRYYRKDYYGIKPDQGVCGSEDALSR